MDFDGFSLKIHEKSWIFRISQGSLGNLGVNLIHPPKLCPRLAHAFSCMFPRGCGGQVERQRQRLERLVEREGQECLGFGVGPELVRETWNPRSISMIVGCRPAHILGGWMRFTPRFPKTPWEILKIHDFSWILMDFH